LGVSAEHVGLKFRMPDYYEVGREKVREFATAVQDDHPAHFLEAAAEQLGYKGLVAPLTFVSILGMLAHKQMFKELGIGQDLRTIMQTDQRFIFHRPIIAGDRLTGEINVDSFREMGGTSLIVTKNSIWNDRDELVQINYTTFISRPDVVVDVVG
jgi:acyl dehydratase